MAKQLKEIDPDNPPLTDEQLAAMRPARDVLPPELFARLTSRKPDQRRPTDEPAAPTRRPPRPGKAVPRKRGG